jgi:hypothetical protein
MDSPWDPYRYRGRGDLICGQRAENNLRITELILRTPIFRTASMGYYLNIGQRITNNTLALP